jgi:hypothetical protein
MDTIKVKPWGKDQGDFVLINAEDFDPEKHEKIEQPHEGAKRGRKPAQHTEAE